MRSVVRTTVRLVLFPILFPIRLLLKRRRKRMTKGSAAAVTAQGDTSSGQVRQRHSGGRREPPSLFSPLALRRTSMPSGAERVQTGQDPEVEGDFPPPDPVGPLLHRTPSIVSCRPAPTLAEIAVGAAAVDVSWTAGPLRFEGFGFAKARGELSEDAFAGHLRTASVAVADGASSSWQAGEWALHLCDAWVSSASLWTSDEHETRVGEFQRSFQDPAQAPDAASSQWFADEVARRGAFAAFLGVSFDIAAGPQVAYRALSVGDVCLLHFRNEMLLASFPITSSDELNSQPELIASSPGRRTSPAKELSGELDSGDVLALATDGVAGYLLGGSATGDILESLIYGPAKDVAASLGTARTAGEMVDDDYTLVRVTL